MSSRIDRGGLHWNLDLNEGIDFSIYLLGAFEPDTVRFYKSLIKPGDVVLDIGANIGAHTLHFARAVGKAGRVFAFEPTNYAFRKLSANLALNPELNAVTAARQILLTDTANPEVPAGIYSSWPLEPEEGLHAEHLGKLQSTQGARSRTLDEVVSELALEKIDFIKLDVDGHELVVLRGGRETLKRFRPPILIELCPCVCAEHHHSFADLIGTLTGLGYRFWSFKGAALPSDADSLEAIIPRNGGINVLAKIAG